MRDKPEACYSMGCPLAVTCHCGHHIELHPDESACTHRDEKTGVVCDCNVFTSKGRGFVLGTGDPKTAKYMMTLEAPGRDEIAFSLVPVSGRSFMSTPNEVNAELARRRAAYPSLHERFIKLGAPIVGPTGVALEMWVFPKVGITRNELFIDNTIRCLPPKGAKGSYPTGEDKKAAEKACRHYDRIEQFKPDTVVATLHPAGILREITPLPLLIKDFERVRDFTQTGKRVLALLGGKAVSAFLRYGENVTKWRGHYASFDAATYKQQFEFKAKQKKRKTVEATRPAELSDVACKSFKRYKGIKPPKCGCAPCWDKFESAQKDKGVAIVPPKPVPPAHDQSFAAWDSIFDLTPGRAVKKSRAKRKTPETEDVSI